MANKPDKNDDEPSGLGEHARGPASEAAHEQGWDINEEKRTEQPKGRPDHYGGNDYDYGAQDFGEVPASTENAESDAGLDAEELRRRMKERMDRTNNRRDVA